MDKIIVGFFSLFGIFATFWFFLMKKETVVAVENSVTIKVNGGYSPEVISIPHNATTTITFLRSDPSNCLEEVVLPDFKIRKFLPLHQKVTIEITPHEKGEFPFSCGMNMFHGKIIVI